MVRAVVQSGISNSMRFTTRPVCVYLDCLSSWQEGSVLSFHWSWESDPGPQVEV